MSRIVSAFPWAAAAVGLAVALSALLGGAIPLVFVFGNFAIYAALLCIVAAGFAAWQGLRRVAIAAAGVALLNAGIASPAFRGPPRPEAGAPTVKLLVYNMRWNNDRFDAMKAMIEKTDPDIVVISEVYARNRGGLRPLDVLYPYRVECWQSPRCDTLIVSRRQLRETFITGDLDGSGLGIARVAFDIGNCPVTMFTAHLTRPWPYHGLESERAQYKQASVFARAIREWSGPKIVAGDFNAATWTSVVAEFARAAKGQAMGGVSGTWPSYLPGPLKLPIDHVIVSRPQISGTREVLAPTGSDHSPVLATLSAECGR